MMTNNILIYNICRDSVYHSGGIVRIIHLSHNIIVSKKYKPVFFWENDPGLHCSLGEGTESSWGWRLREGKVGEVRWGGRVGEVRWGGRVGEVRWGGSVGDETRRRSGEERGRSRREGGDRRDGGETGLTLLLVSQLYKRRHYFIDLGKPPLNYNNCFTCILRLLF